MNAELNCLLVGSGLVPLNIELQQDDRTVCYGHNTVHPHKDLKCTKLCLGPIHTCLDALLGFLDKPKMKAETKQTIVMCCQIVARKSVAPTSGDFCWRPVPWYAYGQDLEF